MLLELVSELHSGLTQSLVVLILVPVCLPIITDAPSLEPPARHFKSSVTGAVEVRYWRMASVIPLPIPSSSPAT